MTLLVATSVAEEGLDIRQCNVVIRFDLAKTVLAYIQSRGRARKPGSDYILMVERYLRRLSFLCISLFFFHEIFAFVFIVLVCCRIFPRTNCGFFNYSNFCSRGNLSHGAFLRNARNSEETLRKEAIERTDLSHLKGTSRLISVDTTPGTVYQVESTGAIVSLNSAVGLIHFYCSQLPSDRYSFYHFSFG